MVKNITENGFIEFEKVGGIIDQFLPYQRVIIHGKENIPGIICVKREAGVTKEELKEKVIRYSDLYIDTGLTKNELNSLDVYPGTIISFDQNIREYKNIFFGKAFDCRVGCFVVIEVAKRLTKKLNICTLFTVQEEIGLKGAKTAIYNLKPKPKLVIEVEITSTTDIPNLDSKSIPIKMGKGPVINIADGVSEGLIGGFIAPLHLISKIRKMKKFRNLQWKVSVGGITDASVIQLDKGGIPTLSIAVLVRYPHTPVGIVKKKDIISTINFIEQLVLSFKNEGIL